MYKVAIPLPFSIYLYPTSWPSIVGGIYGILCCVGFVWLAIRCKLPSGKKCHSCGILSIGFATLPMYLYGAAAFWSAVFIVPLLFNNSSVNPAYEIVTNQVLNIIYIAVIICSCIFCTITENYRSGPAIAILSMAPMALPFIALLSIPLGVLLKVLVEYYPLTLIALGSSIIPIAIIAVILMVIRLKNSSDERKHLVTHQLV